MFLIILLVINFSNQGSKFGWEWLYGFFYFEMVLGVYVSNDL